ncbi:hypothetical protein KM043_006654 [Ampulex compressa]|nr:hypothetical protein KM043_006654 [Ampulex compressa]
MGDDIRSDSDTHRKMEICIDSFESARNAIEGGATRLEICSALSEGGLTPSPGLIKLIRSQSALPIYAMIRARSGDFVYSREEMDAMLHDLKILKEHGVDGFVFGALTSNDEVDLDFCTEILAAARPLPVTFHRAFDELADAFEALEILIDLGFERILTSGQRNTAEEGLELIAKLVQKAGDRISIMAGSGVTKENIARIKSVSGVKEIHASAKRKKLSAGRNRVKMGANEEVDYIMVTDRELVREMVDIIGKS